MPDAAAADPMKSLADHMSMYAAYHRHPVNRAIHFVFVPAIVWTLMIALDRVPVGRVAGIDITAAFIITGVLLAWYLALDLALGIAATFVFTILLVTAIQINETLSPAIAWGIAGGVFVASWIFQFVGHGVWEKRRPALMDNLFQVFVAPMFIVSETAFALGFKKALERDVHSKMQAYLP